LGALIVGRAQAPPGRTGDKKRRRDNVESIS
jgi:hypothetical protein